MDQPPLKDESIQYCANCLAKDNQGTFTSNIQFESEVIPVRQAVTLIYTTIDYQLENDDYYLCEACIEVLSQLYSLYNHFKYRCRSSSRIDIGLSRRIAQHATDPEAIEISVSDVDISNQNSPPSPSPSLPLLNCLELSHGEIEDQIPAVTIREEEDDETTMRLRLKRKSLRRKLWRQRVVVDKVKEPNYTIKDESFILGLEGRDEEEEQSDDVAEEEWQPKRSSGIRRGRGRPRKLKVERATETPKRKRGRPRKSEPNTSLTTSDAGEKRKRGRPRKTPIKVDPEEEQGEQVKQGGPIGYNSSEQAEKVEKDGGEKPKRGRPRKTPMKVDPEEEQPEEVKEGGAIGNNSSEQGEKVQKVKKKRLGRPPGTKNYTHFAWKECEDRKIYTCTQCGKEANTASNLLTHIRCVHEGVREFRCPKCPKKFAGRDGLSGHFRVHHTEKTRVKRFECDVTGCGKSFAYKAGLYAHSFFHNREAMRFVCSHCGRKFRSNFDLQIHATKHSDERTSVCEQCGASFKTKRSMRKHQRFNHRETYRGEGIADPIPTCHVCKKTFVTPGNMHQHVRSVHELFKPHQCKLCGKSFSHGSNLKVHLRGFHGQQEAQVKILAASATSFLQGQRKLGEEPTGKTTAETTSGGFPQTEPEIPHSTSGLPSSGGTNTCLQNSFAPSILDL